MSYCLNEVAEALRKRGFTATVHKNADEVKQRIMKDIGGASVGFGGSMTVRGMEVYESLRENGNEVYWHWFHPDAIREISEKARLADYYITSVNALVKDGRMVSVDGRGNRVAATFHGPKKVLLVVGKNKIVETLDEGMDRIKNYVRPLNAKRLKRDTPCTKNGKCVDCMSPQRICCITLILEYLPNGGDVDIHVYLVDQELGF